MSVEKYLAELDLNSGSPVGKDLFSKLDQECQSELINVAAVYSADGMPAYLTPAMSAWYNRHIQPLRRGAVHDVTEAFATMVADRGTRGRLLEHELDRIEFEAYEKAAEEREQFERDTNITEIHRELSLARQRYEMKVQEHGEAVKWRPVVYWLGLTAIILIFEGLLNLESFLKIPGFTPALSTGSFLAVSLAFGASAHIVGMFLKQWRERFGGGVTRTEKWKNYTVLLALAEPLFFLGFAYVVYARWALLGDVVLRTTYTTGEDIGTWEIVRFAGTLIGNLIVYVAGIGWSYALHDAIPGFSQLRRTVERLQATEAKLIQEEMGKRIRQHFSKASTLKENARNADRAQALQLAGYQSGKNLFNRLREQDARVLALLEDYRASLLDRVSRDHAVMFTCTDVSKVALDPQVKMTAEEYGSKPLELRYL